MKWLNLRPSESAFVSCTAQWQNKQVVVFFKKMIIIRILKDNKITLAINIILFPSASSVFLGRILICTQQPARSVPLPAISEDSHLALMKL